VNDTIQHDEYFQLKMFLSRWRQIQNEASALFRAGPLRQFLSDAHPHFQMQRLRERTRPAFPDPATFAALCGQLGSKLKQYRASGDLIDIWNVAGVGRNELRNTAVLAWMLDPRGSHGQGSALLSSVIRKIERLTAMIELRSISFEDVFVSTEYRPLGSMRDRIDIRIETPRLLTFIEAKIDAGLGFEQLERYRDSVNSKAAMIANRHQANCDTAVVFLTPSRSWAGPEDTLHISWTDIASSLDEIAETAPPLPKLVFQSFAAHMRKF
jgi:hypothetical protein